MMDKVLVIGACGQVGTELVENLQYIHDSSQVVASDIKTPTNEVFSNSEFVQLNVLDKAQIKEVFQTHKPTIVYHLAALLSATAEENPKFGWELNMDGTFNIFDACIEHGVKRIFWPSSIAVFGPTTPRVNTPQSTILEPNTIYGITKLAGERYCEYYFNRYNLDVRSIRYPGLIGWKSLPGGGTTDYAVDIFHQALKNGQYDCFLNEQTTLPMMHMEDAVRATLEITDAPSNLIKVRSSYNIAGVSFNPEQLTQEIKKHIPQFKISYHPDHRQKIANSWPESIDDQIARADWGWQEKAVGNVIRDLNEKVGKYGLIIPTGGGKTRVANRIIIKWIVENQGKVLWVTQRNILLEQAETSLVNLMDELKPFVHSIKLIRLDSSSDDSTATIMVSPNDNKFIDAITDKVQILDDKSTISFFESRTNW